MAITLKDRMTADFVRLRLDNGRTQIVNLGPNVPASRLAQRLQHLEPVQVGQPQVQHDQRGQLLHGELQRPGGERCPLRLIAGQPVAGGGIVTRQLHIESLTPEWRPTPNEAGVRWSYVLGAVTLTVVGIVIPSATLGIREWVDPSKVRVETELEHESRP